MSPFRRGHVFFVQGKLWGGRNPGVEGGGDVGEDKDAVGVSGVDGWMVVGWVDRVGMTFLRSLEKGCKTYFLG